MYHIPRPFSLSKIINTTNCLNYKIYLCWKSPTVLLKPPTQKPAKTILFYTLIPSQPKEKFSNMDHAKCIKHIFLHVEELHTAGFIIYKRFVCCIPYYVSTEQMTKETLTLHLYMCICGTDQHKTYCFRIPHIYYVEYFILWMCYAGHVSSSVVWSAFSVCLSKAFYQLICLFGLLVLRNVAT